MSDSTTMLDLINEAQAGKATSANDLFDAASPAMLYGRRASATAGLTWGYYGGRTAGVLVANGTVTLTASETNYIVADMSTGAVSAATTTTNWDDGANYRRLYKIITGTLSVTSYEDHREAAGGGGGGAFTGGALTSALDEAKGANIASAATTNIGAATGNLVHITGTTTITALGTVQAGTRRIVVFDGILTLTHNAASLILPTGANITTAAGDMATFVSEGSGNWRCVVYQRASGAALAGTSGGMTNPMTTAGDIITGGASGAPQRLAKGMDGQVLTIVSGVPAWAAAGGGGSLTNWTEGVNSASPNATVPVVSLLATNAATNVDAAVLPKGTGAILAQVPDNTAAGGMKRGTNAVDFQRSRTSSDMVASATFSIMLGGQNNRNGSSYGVLVGGLSNIVSGGSANTLVGGESNQASGPIGYASVGGGKSNTAGTNYATVAGGQNNGVTSGTHGAIGGGNNNSISASYGCIPGGNGNVVGGAYSIVLGGLWGTDRNMTGAEVRANGSPSSTGDAQRRRSILYQMSSDASARLLASDGATSASAFNQFLLPNSSAYKFHGDVVARSSTGDAASWVVKGLIKRGANAAATALVGTPTVTQDFADAGAAAWVLTITADTTNGCLKLEVTGAASTSVKWVADIQTVEVVG